MSFKVAVVVGSLRRDSFNAQLARALVKLAPTDFAFKQSEIGDLPLYNQDDDGNPANEVQRLKSEIKSANGLLFVTPSIIARYQASSKMRLTTLLVRNGQSAWVGKPAGVCRRFGWCDRYCARAAAPAKYIGLS